MPKLEYKVCNTDIYGEQHEDDVHGEQHEAVESPGHTHVLCFCSILADIISLRQ
jgi:hypothetical protein